MEENLKYLSEQWIGYKIWLVENIGLSNDALHVHGSLLILCVSAVLLRRRPDSIWCWLIVLIAEFFNEYADLKGLAPGEDSIDASIHDIYNTMFWPTILLVLGRFLFPPRKKIKLEPADTKADSSGDLADQSFKESPTI